MNKPNLYQKVDHEIKNDRASCIILIKDKRATNSKKRILYSFTKSKNQLVFQ